MNEHLRTIEERLKHPIYESSGDPAVIIPVKQFHEYVKEIETQAYLRAAKECLAARDEYATQRVEDDSQTMGLLLRAIKSDVATAIAARVKGMAYPDKRSFS